VILSSRTKESIKTALAMAIAYGIALSLDWDRPYGLELVPGCAAR
jgi:hypothetical protein